MTKYPPQRLTDIAGDNRHSRRVSLRDGLSFGHPSADEHVQPLEFQEGARAGL
jgi:hypothetical protein